MSLRTPSRRQILKYGAAGAAAGMTGGLAMPAIAQTRDVSFTLAWLPQGSSLYTYVAKEKGFFDGLNVSISRGFGSLPAAQSLAAKQFDYGVVLAMPLILGIAQGLPITAIATVDYDAMMGVGVLADSPIKSAADLVGKKIGAVPTSAEYPFFPVYLERSGINPDDVELVHLDNKVLERALTERQVDAIMGIGSSSMPVMLSKGLDVRWILYSSGGLQTYGQTIVSNPETIAADPGVTKAVVEGLTEAIAFTMTDPEESTELFFKAVPEMALNQNGKEFARIGLGMWQYAIAQPEAIDHAIGYGDPTIYTDMIDLVMTYNGTPEMTKPAVEDVFTNDYVGSQTLTTEQWDAVKARVSEFGKLLS
ncbi:ABC transporter substrate-binding protein [Acuticoccus mangrovi]|uniref:ABC transporter substrate-binding protein n=1 Tax=Acuticoccus mangrovi TaxID=2796142 RepID=A0A934INH4_9HYPH|nr:ABC transporter substrate-binding protein [Acuticoccus mangrovi]MBJ3775628.1 ABC transporter substrate-binding protein [Acuticoccus mangrovi]